MHTQNIESEFKQMNNAKHILKKIKWTIGLKQRLIKAKQAQEEVQQMIDQHKNMSENLWQSTLELVEKLPSEKLAKRVRDFKVTKNIQSQKKILNHLT